VLDYLDLNDEEDLFTFQMHCARVYDVQAIKSPKQGVRSLVPKRPLLDQEVANGIQAEMS
jgi:hypothetical protein